MGLQIVDASHNNHAISDRILESAPKRQMIDQLQVFAEKDPSVPERIQAILDRNQEWADGDRRARDELRALLQTLQAQGE